MGDYKQNIEKLTEILRTHGYYESIESLMGWDLWQGLPEKGRPYMENISGFLLEQELKHITNDDSTKVAKFFKNYDLNNIDDIYEKRAINVFLKKYNKTVKVPIQLQIELENTSSQAQMIWRDAYQKCDYKIFEPHLYKMFELKTKVAGYLDNSKSPFEVLVDGIDEGLSVEKTGQLFTELKDAIVKLLDKIRNKDLDVDSSFMLREFDKEKLKNISLDIIQKVGYDRTKSSWGEVLHPFTTGIGPRDSRISTNFKNFDSGLFTFLHESGHGIYNYSSNEKAIKYSLWGGIGGAVHESQSRFYEIIIGKSKEFWNYFYPQLQNTFDEFRNMDVDTFYKAINKVTPCIMRGDADELTYSLHPIIRFEIEKDYFDGKIKISDFQECWNTKYKEYLGVAPKNDREGILQEVHWSMGLMGYFQSYTLGNLYGGQFLNKMLEEIPNVYKEISFGNFDPLNNWLYDNIHQYGCLYTPDELIKKVTKEELKSKYYINYLNKKFSNIYGL